MRQGKSRQLIEIEHRTHEDGQREENYQTANDAVDDDDTEVVELVPHLVNQPRKPEPPDESSRDNAKVAHRHLQRMVGDNEGKLCKGSHEEQDDEWVEEGYPEGRYAIVDERAFLLLLALMHVLRRILEETVNAEGKQNKAAENLKPELVRRVGDEIHHKTHAVARNERIDNIAQSGSNACYKPIPAPFVQSSLNAQDTNRSHRRRGDNPDAETLQNHIYDIYVEYKRHNDCKSSYFSPKDETTERKFASWSLFSAF